MNSRSDELQNLLIDSAKRAYANDEISLVEMEGRIEYALTPVPVRRVTGYRTVGIGNGMTATVPMFEVVA